MTNPKDSYPLARVPERLTKQTIENIPFDEPFFIIPGDIDDFTPPAIFVGPYRELRMSKSFAIAGFTSQPANTLGLVGVMRTFTIDPVTRTIDEKYIADLRYVGENELVDSDSAAPGIEDQEEYMNYVAWLKDSVAFDGFAANDFNDSSANTIPGGSFYGDVALHDALLTLCDSGDKIMEDFYMRNKQATKEKAKTKKKKQKT